MSELHHIGTYGGGATPDEDVLSVVVTLTGPFKTPLNEETIG